MRSQQSQHHKKDIDAKSHSKCKGADHIYNDLPQLKAETYDEDSTADIIHVHSVSPAVPKSDKVPLELNGKHIMMELDIGTQYF